MGAKLLSRLPVIARTLLGLVFFVFGLNFFLHFLPQPPMAPRAGDLMGAMMRSGYMFTLVKMTEVVAGVLLLSGRFVPLALALLAPIVINILMFHVMLAPEGIPVAIIIALVEAYVAWAYRSSFKPMLRSSASYDPS